MDTAVHTDALEALLLGKRFTARKADISSGVNQAVTASRAVLAAGDVTSLVGWSLWETTNAAGATINLHDGSSIAGELIANATLNANESIRDLWYPWGIIVATGRIWLEVVSGSVAGVLYYRIDE